MSEKHPFVIDQSIMVALRLSAGGRNTQDVAALIEQPLEHTHAALSVLARRGVVRCENLREKEVYVDCLWFCDHVDAHSLHGMAQDIQDTFPIHSLPYNYSLLCGEESLAACERVALFLDARVKSGEAGVLLCLEMLLRTLLRWGALHQNEKILEHRHYVELVLAVQGMCIFTEKFLDLAHSLTSYAQNVATNSGNTRFGPVINIFRSYMQLFVPRELHCAAQEIQAAFEELSAFADEDMRSMLPAFEGLLHYVRGEYQETLQCYSQRYEMQHWLYKYFFSAFSMASSQSAMYLRQYHLCIGINEAERHSAEISGERLSYLLWRSVFCFVLLRKGDFENALVHIDYLVCNVTLNDGDKVFSSTIRALTLYHYMHGRIKAAYHVLLNATLLAQKRDVQHSPFRDPLILNILFAFEEHGYKPIPRYELPVIIEHILEAPNVQLRAAALRIQAQRCKRDGAPSSTVESMLNESFRCARISGDPAEMSLALHDLALCLEKRIPQQAHELRRQIKEIIGTDLHTELSQRAAVIIATCGERSQLGAQSAMPSRIVQGASANDEDIQERCFRAFRKMPTGDDLTATLHRLLSIIQLELACERALLLGGVHAADLRLVTSVSMSAQEYYSADMWGCRQWIALHAARKERIALCCDRQSVCINLGNEDELWVLYLHNSVTNSKFFDLSPATMEELARLFASEVRLIRCVQKVREEASQRHWEKILRTDEQKGRDTPPVVGDGLHPVYEQAHRVSMTDAPVLLLGETGVGKEILARYIHQLSGRSGPFVPIHLASTQELLFESELFGYERGAFTGAHKQKIGLLEVANNGTLFIDEVGDIPPNVQTKLLRVLQDRRFIRVGGTREIHTNFRLVAATNKILDDEVRSGHFRKDLLYRISVVPLEIPPLRERRQDIVRLAQVFVEYFCQRYGRAALALSPQQEEQLCAYEWPGNVRELKNTVERAIILSKGTILDMALPSQEEELSGAKKANAIAPMELTHAAVPTLPEIEAHHLRQVLALTGGKVRGPQGAETLLKMKRSTLYAKLRKYGIPTA